MKEVFVENLKKISESVKEALKKEDVRSLSKTYIELDEVTKQADGEMSKIKKFLSKKEFKEEFADLGKYVQNVEGRSMSHISNSGLLQDFNIRDLFNIASVTETSLRKFLEETFPNESKEEIDSRINKYKVNDGKGSPSIRIYKMKE